MITLSVDPGDNTAVAVWKDGELQVVHFLYLLEKEKKWPTPIKHEHLVSKFQALLQNIQESTLELADMELVIEGVGLWGGSVKSQTSALRGDLFRLAYLVGGMVSTFNMLEPCGKVTIVDVRKWKGQMPTDVLIKHLTQMTGEAPRNEHCACAIGIGLHHFGKF